jgi:hypothetical protein
VTTKYRRGCSAESRILNFPVGIKVVLAQTLGKLPCKSS